MIEKGRDCVGVQIGELQRSDIPAIALSGEHKQELQRVPIGANRVRARATLAWQVLDEEGFNERKQLPLRSHAHCGDRASRRCCSNRLLASSKSCGVAFK